MLKHLLGITDRVRLQVAEPTPFSDVQMKNPDVSLETLKSDRTPSSATKRQKRLNNVEIMGCFTILYTKFDAWRYTL